MLNNTAGYVRPVPHHSTQSPSPSPASKSARKGMVTQCPRGTKRTPRREVPSDRPGFRRFEFFEPIPVEELSEHQIRRTALMNLNRRESRSEGGYMPTRPIEL